MAKKTFLRSGWLIWISLLPPEVLDALHKKIDEGALGYPIAPDSLLKAITDWQKNRHGWVIGKEAVTWAPGVVAGLAFSIMAYTKPGDGVIIQTPVYPPFYATISESGRRIVKNPLKREDGRYVMDLEGLEKLVTPTCRTLILCSPHNPVARVWSREELEALAEVAERKDMIIISDEIHQDLVYSDAKHISLAALSGEMSSRTVTFVAPSKTFNIAGMNSSVALIPDEKLRARYVSVLKSCTSARLAYLDLLQWRRPTQNVPDGLTNLWSTWKKTGIWLKDLSGNVCRKRRWIIRKVHVFWIDFRGYGFDSEKLMDFLVNDAGSRSTTGGTSGPKEKFARINIGTNRKMLKEALEKIAKALEAKF